MLIFSKPKTAKVRDMQRSPAVSLALDSADGGQDIVLADGRAKLITAAGEHPHFLAGQFRLARGGRTGAGPHVQHACRRWLAEVAAKYPAVCAEQ
jgi:hypothetical protein